MDRAGEYLRRGSKDARPNMSNFVFCEFEGNDLVRPAMHSSRDLPPPLVFLLNCQG